MPELWHHCLDCDEKWFSDDSTCMGCGRQVPADLTGQCAPRITSGMLVAAMSDAEWKHVRRAIGVDDW